MVSGSQERHHIERAYLREVLEDSLVFITQKDKAFPWGKKTECTKTQWP